MHIKLNKIIEKKIHIEEAESYPQISSGSKLWAKAAK